MKRHPIVLFVHIPKAAGTGAAVLFYEQYKEKLGVIDMNVWDRWQERMRAAPYRFDCLFGHFSYGIHEDIARAAEYTSVMRNPIDAILSYHSFIVSKPNHPFHQFMGNGSLDQFLKLPRELLFVFRNYQTTMLTGKLNATASEAIELIGRKYPILGTVERLPETIYFWQKRYGWGEVVMRMEEGKNASEAPRKLSLAEIRGIEELVRVDLDVYAFVRSRLAQKIIALSSGEKAAIRELKETGRLSPFLH